MDGGPAHGHAGVYRHLNDIEREGRRQRQLIQSIGEGVDPIVGLCIGNRADLVEEGFVPQSSHQLHIARFGLRRCRLGEDRLFAGQANSGHIVADANFQLSALALPAIAGVRFAAAPGPRPTSDYP